MPKNRMTLDRLAAMIAVEFQAVRREMADGLAAVRQEMAEGFAAVRETLSDHSARLNRIERKLDNTIERVDERAVRLARLEKGRP
jgi:hypothetical protein